MNTIYDNTFVLGQTSAMNFQAGPGISITQPAEGTVRIANDETVLWTQDGTFNEPGKTLTFAEPASAFEKLEFRCGVDVQSKECVSFEYHPGNAVVSWHEYYDGKFRQFYSLLSVNDTGITAVSGCPYFAYLVSGSTFTAHVPNWQWCFRAIVSIHGINRKEV